MVRACEGAHRSIGQYRCPEYPDTYRAGFYVVTSRIPSAHFGRGMLEHSDEPTGRHMKSAFSPQNPRSWAFTRPSAPQLSMV